MVHWWDAKEAAMLGNSYLNFFLFSILQTLEVSMTPDLDVLSNSQASHECLQVFLLGALWSLVTQHKHGVTAVHLCASQVLQDSHHNKMVRKRQCISCN